MTVTVQYFCPLLISIHEPFIVFSLPYSAEKRSNRAALVGGCQPRSAHHSLVAVYKQTYYVEKRETKVFYSLEVAVSHTKVTRLS